jgi:hypothetical protein
MKAKAHVSKALTDVWEWKDACYREVAHMPRRKALLKLLDDAERSVEALKLCLPQISARRVGLVAEDRATYGKRTVPTRRRH